MVRHAGSHPDSRCRCAGCPERAEAPIPPRQHLPDLDEAWEELILKCLERDPEDRISDAEEIVAFLESLTGREETPNSEGRKKSWWPFATKPEA